jgi:ribonuclease Y
MQVDDIIRDAGEQATFEINVHNMHPDLVKILGRLKVIQLFLLN